jgi:hypothetical protein
MKVVFTIEMNFHNPNAKLSEVYDGLKKVLASTFAADSKVGLVCAGPSGIDSELEVEVHGKWLL